MQPLSIKSSLIPLFLFILFISPNAYSSHIRAGEITAVRTSDISLSYRFTFIGYRDTKSPIPFGEGKIDFGDGSQARSIDEIKISHTRELIGEYIEKNTFIFEHTFPNNSEYTISYREEYRNDKVLTMFYSFGTPFYIETKIIIDPYFGLNATPLLLVPPIDKGTTGVIFLHNPGAFDAEGDSLSYKIIENKQDKDDPVNGFKFPNDASLYTGLDYEKANQAGNNRPSFTLDPVTGDLVWATTTSSGGA